MNNIAFIPLRAGGKRVGLIDGLDKERALLGKQPLMAYTIRWAIESGVFDDVMAVTASKEHGALAQDYGASLSPERPSYTTRDESPDIEWVDWILNELGLTNGVYSILRVTSPFRTDENIREAYQDFYIRNGAHSLRTVTPVSEHPAKMWVIRQQQLLPLLPMGSESFPWHSSGTQTLFKTFVQTAGMEFSRVANTLNTKTIAGSNVIPYVVEGWPALDINDRFDWLKAEQGVENGSAPIPESLK
jgi:CMP-N-acetylneuraminic acid synthetase